MTEIPKSRIKDVITAAEFQQMHRNGIFVTKGRRIKTQELLPEFAKHLDNKKVKNAQKVCEQNNDVKFASYLIPVPLCTLNDYINAERTDKYKAANIKRKMTNICARYCDEVELNKTGLYDIELLWVTPDNKRDPDNIFFGIKWILDGLVTSGKLKNDGRKNIRNIHHNIKTKAGEAYVVVKLIAV